MDTLTMLKEITEAFAAADPQEFTVAHDEEYDRTCQPGDDHGCVICRARHWIATVEGTNDVDTEADDIEQERVERNAGSNWNL